MAVIVNLPWNQYIKRIDSSSESSGYFSLNWGGVQCDNLFLKCSLRLQFHVEESPVNPLHGSDSTVAAEKEIRQLFPVQSTLAVIKPEMEPDKRGWCLLSLFHFYNNIIII